MAAAIGALLIAACGGGDDDPPPPPPPPALAFLAGDRTVTGTADGVGAAARFNGPSGMVPDRAGNLYVTDTSNHAIRKITPAGAVTTFAGLAGSQGSADGTGTAARFSLPMGIAIDAADNLYVADALNHTIRRITPGGVVSTIAGAAGQRGFVDGSGTAARFNLPYGVALDGAGTLYITDSGNRIVRRMLPSGDVSTIAGQVGVSGNADGPGTTASFGWPNAIVRDDGGNLYLTDTASYTIRKITPAFEVSTIAGTPGTAGWADGSGGAALFKWPWSITQRGGTLYVSDSIGHVIRKVTPAGEVTTPVGQPGVAGFTTGALPGTIDLPAGLTFVGDTLYFTARHSVAKVTNMR